VTIMNREECRPAIHKYVDKIIDRIPEEGPEMELFMCFICEISKHARVNEKLAWPGEGK